MRRVVMEPLSRWGLLCALLGVGLSAAAPAEAGIKIVPTFDESITTLWNARQVMDTVNKVIQFYESKLTDNITVNITFMDMDSGLGQSQKPVYLIPYASFLTALTNDATSANDTTALANLPKQNQEPVLRSPYLYVFPANLKALGFRMPQGPDGIIGLNTGITFTSTSNARSDKYDLYATICHELDECLGLGSGVGFNGLFPQDLYRYDANGQRSFTTDPTAAAYFSLDGSVRRAQFSQTGFADYGDWYSGFDADFNPLFVTPQAQDAFATPGVVVNRSLGVELMSLDVIGYDIGVTKKKESVAVSGGRYSGARVGYQKPGPKPKVTMNPRYPGNRFQLFPRE
jgi:hypothetical protein